MYELYNGSERLMSAFACEIDNQSFIRRLASMLNYMPEQLQQDIRAMQDRLSNESLVRNELGADTWEKILNRGENV